VTCRCRLDYEAGLRAGFQDESLGILEPAEGYPDSDPYLAGVCEGRRLWRQGVGAAMVVDREPIGDRYEARPTP